MTDCRQPLAQRVLHAIFHLSRATRPIDASALAREIGASASEAATACIELEGAGLVDATRARLTMLGLAEACATGASSGGEVLRPPERSTDTAARRATRAAPRVERQLPPLAAGPAGPASPASPLARRPERPAPSAPVLAG